MSGVRPRLLPSLPAVSAFPEVNVRTYVSYRGHRGVWFLSLDAGDRLAVEVARRVFRLPYYRARMTSSTEQDGWVTYAEPAGRRRGDRMPRSRAATGPAGPVDRALPGSRAHFLTARDGLWSLDRREPRWVGIRHAPWPLQPAELDARRADALRRRSAIHLVGPPADLWFSRRLDVVAWRPVRI